LFELEAVSKSLNSKKNEKEKEKRPPAAPGL
jgi:hypothetical protein